MPEHPLSRLRIGPRTCATVLVFIALVCTVRNLPWHLDDYDQAKQAFVSFEMVKQGHWWFQHTPTERIATKPPLAGWLSAGIWLGTGGFCWDLAWRLPGVVATGLLIWSLARMGARLAGWEGGTLAAAAFGLNLTTPRLATLVRTDMLLTLFIALAGFLIYEKLRTGRAWTTGERWLLFAALLGSMLTKGPIVYAFLLPGLVAFWWCQRGKVTTTTAWSGWWSWFGPLIIFGAWAGVGVMLSPEFYDQVVRREFLGRFTVGETAVHHNQPIYFYFLQLLRNLFPWSIALLALAAERDVRARLRRDPALLWLVCWSLGGLLCMSLVPSKRGDRIFPIVPPLCLLVPAMAAMLPEQMLFGERRVSSAQRALLVIALATVFAGGYAGFRFVEGYRQHDRALVDFGKRVLRLAPPERVAVISGKDEGMLLYLQRPGFVKWDEARSLFEKGAVDIVVAPFDPEKPPALTGARADFASVPAREKSSRYVCLVRSPPQP